MTLSNESIVLSVSTFDKNTDRILWMIDIYCLPFIKRKPVLFNQPQNINKEKI